MPNKRGAIKDADLAKVGLALERAAKKARNLGFATNTPVYVFRNGKIVDIVAEQRAKQFPKKVGANGRTTQKQPLGGKTSNTKAKRQ